MRLGRLLAIASLSLTAFAASAAPNPADTAPWAKPYVGRWSIFGGSEGDPYCGLALKADTGIGGAQLEMSATCRRNFPFEDVAFWRLDGKAITLIDALRKPVVSFKPLPDKSYAGDIRGGEAVFLERGPPEKPASLRALFDEGTFTLSGPNNANPCGFGVEAKTSVQGKLEQAGRCAPQWKGKGWASWSAQGDKLQLKDKKGTPILTLTRADEYTFTADVAGKPVFFGPGVIDGSEMLER